MLLRASLVSSIGLLSLVEPSLKTVYFSRCVLSDGFLSALPLLFVKGSKAVWV